MANQLLTTDMIADRALMRFSEALSFTKTIPRTYDSSFQTGAPAIGDTLRVPIPQHAVINHGRVATPAPMKTLVRPVTIQDQVNFSIQYTSAELALDIEEFDRRYLSQQVADLAVNVEAAVQNLAYQSIPNQTGTPDGQWTQLAYANIARKYIEDNGGGKGTKKMLTNNAADTTIIPALSGLFNAQRQIDVQYEEGVMGRASGFDWVSSTVAPVHQRGTANASYDVNGANQTGSSIAIDTGSGTFLKGDIVTFAGCVAVHPQTKQSLGYLRQFTVTEDLAGPGNLQIYPAIVTSGSEKNVTASPTDGGDVVIQGTASDTYGVNLAYRPEAFAFVTVDLPELTGWKNSRRQFEGISMRVVEASDAINDMNMTRFDIMWGFGALRPEWACRIANDPANLTPA
ncbi:P22 phage major capsid protein family protein [Pseudoxanthomonas sp.]|uniref:P22 phage major capsid protein family protein n=1 Tax=Pseudoxanthomonas sp. TaxID=1871049 RepID=UPI003F80E3FC